MNIRKMTITYAMRNDAMDSEEESLQTKIEDMFLLEGMPVRIMIQQVATIREDDPVEHDPIQAFEWETIALGECQIALLTVEQRRNFAAKVLGVGADQVATHPDFLENIEMTCLTQPLSDGQGWYPLCDPTAMYRTQKLAYYAAMAQWEKSVAALPR